MNVKKLLPFENFVMTTQLPVEEVLRRLTLNVEPKGRATYAASKLKPGMPYRGQVLDNTFSISRIINYRNSFLPEIKGIITTKNGETLIKVKMQPVDIVLIFMVFWLGSVGLVCIGIIIAGIINLKVVLHGGFSPMVLGPFGMFAFGFLLIAFGFRGEARRSKDFLTKLFEAQRTA